MDIFFACAHSVGFHDPQSDLGIYSDRALGVILCVSFMIFFFVLREVVKIQGIKSGR